MLPPPLKIRKFSADEVSRAIELAKKLEPDAWKSLQNHDAGVHLLEREEYRNNIEKIRPHLRQLDITNHLADQTMLLHEMRVEMRKRLGLPT